MVEDHVLDEEEDIFDAARKAYSNKELEEIGKEFLEEKKKIMGEKGLLSIFGVSE